MLVLQNISYSYWKELILKDFSWEFRTGLNCIYGPSWKGKTTLLKIIWGLIMPDAGQVFFWNKNICSLSSKELAYFRWNICWMYYVGQVILDNFKVKDLLFLHERIFRQTIDKSRYSYLMENLEMTNEESSYLKSLSTWQRERLYCIKALLHKPQILLLDEPWANLDGKNQQKLYSVIQEYSQDHIVICVTHDNSLLELSNHRIQLWNDQ